MRRGRRILILGGGPIGVEAAVHAAGLGYDVRLLEAHRVGSHLLRWGHVRMFSPWSMNCSPEGLRVLKREGVRPFNGGARFPTGREFVRDYLEPLSRSRLLKGRVEEGVRAIAIGRDGLLKGDRVGRPARALRPFRVLVWNGRRQRVVGADLLIDATGTYAHPRHLGNGGIPAPGEQEAAPYIDYHLVDLLGRRARDFAGRRTLLVGSGHSAAAAVVALAELARRAPQTRVVWAFRCRRRAPIVRVQGDPLLLRDRQAAEANTIAAGSVPAIRALRGATIEAVHLDPAARRSGGRRGGFRVSIRTEGGRLRRERFDRILAHVGYAPDRSLYAELQVHECYATGGPMKIAASLIGEAGAGADCLRQPGPTADLLSNPEPGFFILGSKSYGRNPNFLMRTGHEQIRALFEALRRGDTARPVATGSGPAGGPRPPMAAAAASPGEAGA
ncbi:MAG: hypothetical protein ACE5JH_09480 [Acidobacteriota bacterium]